MSKEKLFALHFIYDNEKNPWLAGGGFVRAREIYSRFPKDKQILICCGNFKGAVDYSIAENIRVVFLGLPMSSYMLSRISFVLAGVYYALKHGKNSSIIVDDYSPYSPLLLTKLLKKKVVITQLQNYFGKKMHLQKFGVLGYLFNVIEALSYKTFRNVLTVSTDLHNTVKSKLSKNISSSTTINCGVDTKSISLTNELRLSQFLSLGRIELQQKGIDRLLSVYQSACDLGVTASLLIVGSGKDDVLVREMITNHKYKDRITLLSRVEGSDKYKLMNRSLAVVMLSRFESWGMVSIEAQASGTPVVVSNIKGLRQTILDRKTGWLVNSDEEATALLVKIANAPNIVDNMQEACVEWSKNFDWSKLAVSQLEYYNSCVTEH